MPIRTITLLDYTQNRSVHGLSLTGPSTEQSPSALRKARGLHESCYGELRPAPGNTLLYAVANIHSISRFNDARFYAAGTVLYRDGSSLLTGLSGNFLTLMRLPPGNSQPDQLFVAGGGLGRKISTTYTVTNWGIDPPSDGMTATIQAQLTKDIELFNTAASWTVSGTGVVASDEATIKQEGANSLQVDVPLGTLAILTKAVAVNLSLFSVAGDSSEEDFIEMWIRIDGARGFEYCTLRFDVGSGDFASDYYQYKILPRSVTINTDILTGVGDRLDVRADEVGFIESSDGSDEGVADGTEGVDAAGVDGDGSGPSGSADAAYASASWSRLRIRKKDFLRTGNNANTWANVAAMQLIINVNDEGANTLYFDRCRMIGGAGLHGNYKSLVTFDNTTTGARSNSNATPVLTFQNERQRLLYQNIPVSSDPQVNARTLWRTLGGGAAFFREHVIEDNSTTSYNSRVADYVGLWSNDESDVLYLPELQTDNIRPLETHIDFMYDQATVFWIPGAAGLRGRLYYAPAGRPEAQRGWIQVSNDDAPLYRALTFNRARYVFGESRPYRIDGTEPYIPYPFEGVPGINQAQARTLVSTPYGIIWQAHDGLRRFNGTTSELLFFDRIGPIFRGEALESFTNFQGQYAGFARDQYFISDGIQGLSINLATGFIRDLGQGFTAFHYEADTRNILAGTSAGLVILEDVNAAPSVACSWETVAFYGDPKDTDTCLRLYLDVDTNSQALSVTLIIDGVDIALPPCTTNRRAVVEYAIGRAYLSMAVRLTMTPTRTFKVFKIYADTYKP